MAGNARTADGNSPRRGQRRRPAAAAAAATESGDSRSPGDAETRTLVRLELASIRASAAFRDWALEIHRRAGGPALGAREVLLLHGLHAGERPQSLSELRRLTNARSLATLRTALARLCAAGLLRASGGGAARDPVYVLTAKGARLAARCDRLRDQVLVTLCRAERDLFDAMRAATTALERVAAVYGQATRYVGDLSVLDGSNPYTRDAP